MSGTSGGYTPPRVFGESRLPATFDLSTLGVRVFANATGCEVALPVAGRYRLRLYARGNMAIPPEDTAIVMARLWDDTTGVVVPGGAAMLASQLNTGSANATLQITGSAETLYDAAAGTVITMQGGRSGPDGLSASLESNADGYSSIAYELMS